MEQRMEKDRMCNFNFDTADNKPKLEGVDCFTTSNRGFQFGIRRKQFPDESAKKQVSGKAGMRGKLRSGKSAHSLGQLVAYWFSHRCSFYRCYAGW